ncbi:STAS domain-containing protein [Methylomagnum sp.]
MLSISSTPQGEGLIIGLIGRIDVTSAKDLERHCLAWIDQGQRQLIFDFTKVDYISSAGLRVFLLIAKRLGAAQGAMRLCAMNATLRDVFEISGFSKLFTILPTVAEAL